MLMHPFWRFPGKWHFLDPTLYTSTQPHIHAAHLIITVDVWVSCGQTNSSLSSSSIAELAAACSILLFEQKEGRVFFSFFTPFTIVPFLRIFWVNMLLCNYFVYHNSYPSFRGEESRDIAGFSWQKDNFSSHWPKQVLKMFFFLLFAFLGHTFFRETTAVTLKDALRKHLFALLPSFFSSLRKKGKSLCLEGYIKFIKTQELKMNL